MRIKFYFSILVLFLLGLGGVLLYLAKGMKPLHLYIVEGIIAFILVFLFIFYRKIVKPMNIIGSGMELLREQDFSSRLSKVGQYEADRIVNVFNRMREQLRTTFASARAKPFPGLAYPRLHRWELSLPH